MKSAPHPPAHYLNSSWLSPARAAAPAGQLALELATGNGRPLAGFPVELVSERSALGIWRETDADGKLRHSLPFPGRWLLRGTDLRASAQGSGRWESRFVTLAIEAR